MLRVLIKTNLPQRRAFCGQSLELPTARLTHLLIEAGRSQSTQALTHQTADCLQQSMKTQLIFNTGVQEQQT